MEEKRSLSAKNKKESDLQASYERYKLIFDLAADAIFIGNLAGEFTEVNESAILLTGYTRGELVGKPMSFLFSKEQLERSPLRYDLLKKGEVVKVERWLTRKDLSLVPIEMNSRMLPNGTFQAVIRENRETVEMKQGLEDLLARQKVLIDAAFEAIFISVDGICVAQNRMAEEMFGYSEEEAIGKPGTDWIVPEERKKVKHRILSGIEGSYETIGLRKDGSSFPAEIQARMTTYDGKTARVTMLRDITLRKKAELDLLTIQKLESVGTLAGGLAHDLNNILTGLLGNLSLAKTRLQSSHQAYKFITKAEESLSRFTHITNKLLTFSKGGKPVIGPVELAGLVEEIIHFDLAGSNVIPVTEKEPELWLANVDKGQIEQVFSNLVINAKQAMAHGGNVYFYLTNFDNSVGKIANLSPGLYVKAEIRDEGAGIDEAHLNNIFDPYFTTKEGGSGLGLTSVHSIVSQHKGMVTVSSKVNQGTLFTLYLPATGENSEPGSAAVAEKNHVEQKNYKVLVVDDDKEVCTVCSSLLHSLGCEVVVSHKSDEAVEQFERAEKSGQPFDIAILDLTIPGESGGVETVRRLLKINAHTHMIVSSGYSDNPVMANFRDYGFSAVLAKPYTRDKLKDVLG